MSMSNNFADSLVSKALRLLDAAGAEYKVIVNGQEYGQLQLFPQKKERKFAWGERRKYYKPYLRQLSKDKPYVQIPSGGYPLLDIQSGASAVLSHMFGPGAYTTTINRDLDVVEVVLL
jgi:hypothetical protein